MNPILKRDVFETISNATTEKMTQEKVMDLTNKVIDIFVENNLEYSQAHAVMDCVGITLEARKSFLNP